MEDPKKSSQKSKNGKKIAQTKKPSPSTSTPHSSPSTEKQAKLRTSKDIYNRLKWDAASLDVDLSKVYIGYKDRFLGICEIPFSSFRPFSSSQKNEDEDLEDDNAHVGVGGEIPYHRIYYFRGGGPPLFPTIGKDGEVQVAQENWPPATIFYWDRESRQDLIFNSGNKPTMTTANKLTGGGNTFSNLPSYKYNSESQNWEVQEIVPEPNEEQEPQMTNFKLLTLNVLFDLYEPTVVQCSKRWPHLLKFLRDSEADIIALQEVTRSFLTLLEAEDWVRSRYYLTESSKSQGYGPSTSQTIDPYGQIFLTKIAPSRLLFTTLPGPKRTIIATLAMNERLLHVANIHLSSNAKGDASSRRRSQIATLLQVVSGMEQASLGHGNGSPSDVIVVGDTNFCGDEGLGHNLDLEMDLVDAWQYLGNDDEHDPGFTFDVANNFLAQQLSKRGQSERYDRVYFKATNAFTPNAIRVLGKDPISESLWISDHYAVECQFKLREVSNPSYSRVNELPKATPLPTPSKLVYTSAIAIIPPRSIWDKIQPIRALFDPSHARWPPHVTLFHKFRQEDRNNFEDPDFHRVTSALNKGMSPFTVNLTRIKSFQHANSTTIYLAPEEPEAELIAQIYHQLLQNYPEVEKEGREFRPHLTLAKLPTGTPEEVVQKLVAKWEQELLDHNPQKLSFTLDSIHFIARVGDGPFRIKNTIKLGNHQENQKQDPVLENFIQTHNLVPVCHNIAKLRSQIVQELGLVCGLAISSILKDDEVDSATNAAIRAKCQLFLAGSTFMGFNDDSSDLDFLFSGPPNVPYRSFFSALESIMFSKPASSQSATPTLKLDSIVLDTSIPIARFILEPGLHVDLVYFNNNNSIDLVSPLELTPEEISVLDLASIKSINAVREGHKLLEIIPSTQLDLYRVAVRSLRFWAKQRNVYGLLGSSQISILAAYVLLGSKIKTPEELVAAFFETFSTWGWPQAVKFHENSEKCPINFANPGKKIPELMPIHSPCYPYLNRNLGVTKSTRNLLTKEFQRADSILSRVLVDFSQSWEMVVGEKAKFFESHAQNSNFCKIMVEIEKESDVRIVQRIVKGKLLRLLIGLDNNTAYRKVEPYPNIITMVGGVFANVEIDIGNFADQFGNVKNLVLCFIALGELDDGNLVDKDNSEGQFQSVVDSFCGKLRTLISSSVCKGGVDIKVKKVDKDDPGLKPFLNL